MQVTIVDYGSGNLRSAAKAFERAAATGDRPARVTVTSDPEAVARADRIVLPGVGAFADCRAGLLALDGMVEALRTAVIDAGRPFLGICVGMQLLATRGREHGDHPGFGWIPGEVVALSPADPALKIPHMGWNELRLRRPVHPLLAGLPDQPHAYFVHGYHFLAEDPDAVIAEVDYGGTLAAAVARDNIAGTQFHPEKSQALGLALIANFLRWSP